MEKEVSIMFGFGRKKRKEENAPQEEAPISEAEEQEEFHDLVEGFQPEVLEILALTGPNIFAGDRDEGKKLWKMSVGLTAWLEEDVPGVHQGEFELVTLADDKLRKFLKTHVPQDFILRFKARVSGDGKQLLMVGLPEPGFDAELKAIQDEQKKPVTFWIDGLGTFTLVRSVGWFSCDVEWLGESIQLTMDRDENRADAVLTAQALMAGQEKWDGSIRAFAAEKLVDLANQWAVGSEEETREPPEEVTAEQFMERMELESIQVYGNGSFEFWFNDGDMFWGHSIHILGSLEEGPTDAHMEE